MSVLKLTGAAFLAAGAAVAIALFVTGADYPDEAPRHALPTDPAPFQPRPDVPASPARRTVVVMLFDGLAPALLDGLETPALDRLRREGSWTHNLIPPFPTGSLIGGFTISTGCWPENHGIVTNRFFDPARGLYDHSKDADWVTGCEQLHEVAERQGVHSAALGWYGEVSSKRGLRARTVEYAASWADYPTDHERAQQVARLIERPVAQRPQLILAYFKGPDRAAHSHGMDAKETQEAVREVDRAVAIVLGAIEGGRPRNETTLIVTTDHGMVPITHLINLEYLLRRHDIEGRMLATGTTALLYLNDPSTLETAVEHLSGYAEFDLILPHEQPDWSHLGTGPRVGDLIVSAKPGYTINDRGKWPWFFRWLAWTGPMILDSSNSLKASHGYPPDTPGVQGILYAWGDGIVADNEIERIDAVDIHPTVTHLLDIEPGSPVDGSVVTTLLSSSAAVSPERRPGAG